MKTEDIKTWRDRITTPTTNQKNLFMSMQAEIDELRAALKERDAEKAEQHECYQRVCREYHAQRAVMQQALEAAEKFRAKCHDGRARSVETYDDMTQLVTALKEAMK